MSPGRSPVFAVARKLSQEGAERHDRPAGGRRARRQGGRGDPPAAHCIRQLGIRQKRAAARAGRNQFSNHPVPIHHQHRLATGHQANVLAQLVFQNLQAYGSHVHNVASGSYQWQALWARPDGASTIPQSMLIRAGHVIE